MIRTLRTSFLFLLLAGPVWADAPPTTVVDTVDRHSLELGVVIENLYPTHLLDFNTPASAYGLVVGVPIGFTVIQVQGAYSYVPQTRSAGIALYLLDLDLRINIQTPFFTGYILGGPHLLSYKLDQTNQTFIGGNVGVGLAMSMAKSVSLHLDLKIYIQQQSPVTSFGGGINVFL